MSERPPRDAGTVVIALVAGEESGDALGAPLMRALRQEFAPRAVRFVGVGGEAMAGEGLASLFPLADIAVMGISAVIARLPLLFRRIRETASMIVAARPDALVIIDSPDFTHRVARRVRAKLPRLSVIDYVSPSVWAWRPGRARAMRAYVDHVLALLPFEPDAHRRLGGPGCTYVGHPLSQRLDDFTPSADDEAARLASPPMLVVLPGSRRSEIVRLLPVFGEAVAKLAVAAGAVEVVLPSVPWLSEEIGARTRSWAIRPRIVAGEVERLAAFKRARAALAASGTVSLELALAGVPMVGAYRIGAAEFAILRHLVATRLVLLPNLILGAAAVPELIQYFCTADVIAEALRPLLEDTPDRAAQLAALALVRDRIAIPGETPAARAARVVAQTIDERR